MEISDAAMKAEELILKRIMLHKRMYMLLVVTPITTEEKTTMGTFATTTEVMAEVAKTIKQPK